MATRLLIVGLDGAGFDLVSKLMDAGDLPTLRAMAAKGAAGPLRSTTPPITGPSWLGLATGLDTDQTGICDFLVRRPPLFDMRPITSRDFEGRAVWDTLGASGARVAVFNFPILFPPYPVNGVMVSGFGTDESTQWTYPEGLKRELLEATGPDYNLTINYHHEVYDDAHRFLDDLDAALARRLDAAELVCRREPWDLFFVVLSETDWLLHRCWADLDPSHPRYDAERSPAVAERALAVWRRVDAGIARLVDAMGDGASTLVCSDHGFGPNTATIRINLLLEREGLLVRKQLAERPGAVLRRASARAAQRAGAVAARIGGPVGRALGRARRHARRYLPRDESAYLASVVDLDRSVAFDAGHTIPFAGLYVAPRFPRGSAEYVAALDRVEAALDRFGRESGIAIATHRAWLESADRLETLPDLVVAADDWGATFLKADFSGEPFVRASYSSRHTGSHRPLGLYLASGPAFVRHEPGVEASILDVAPTVLAVLGVATPAGRRGRVLDELLATKGERRAAPPEIQHTAEDGAEDEEADMRERLRGLGYIE